MTISGANTQATANGDVKYLHRGIAERGFERRFQLAAYVFVKGVALNNGLLVITLQREVPEALKPRSIEVSKSDQKLINPKPNGKTRAA